MTDQIQVSADPLVIEPGDAYTPLININSILEDVLNEDLMQQMRTPTKDLFPEGSSDEDDRSPHYNALSTSPESASNSSSRTQKKRPSGLYNTQPKRTAAASPASSGTSVVPQTPTQRVKKTRKQSRPGTPAIADSNITSRSTRSQTQRTPLRAPDRQATAPVKNPTTEKKSRKRQNDHPIDSSTSKVSKSVPDSVSQTPSTSKHHNVITSSIDFQLLTSVQKQLVISLNTVLNTGNENPEVLSMNHLLSVNLVKSAYDPSKLGDANVIESIREKMPMPYVFRAEFLQELREKQGDMLKMSPYSSLTKLVAWIDQFQHCASYPATFNASDLFLFIPETTTPLLFNKSLRNCATNLVMLSLSSQGTILNHMDTFYYSFFLGLAPLTPNDIQANLGFELLLTTVKGLDAHLSGYINTLSALIKQAKETASLMQGLGHTSSATETQIARDIADLKAHLISGKHVHFRDPAVTTTYTIEQQPSIELSQIPPPPPSTPRVTVSTVPPHTQPTLSPKKTVARSRIAFAIKEYKQ